MILRSSGNHTEGYILGVDGGGSKTTAQIAGTSGKKLLRQFLARVVIKVLG